MQNAAVVLIPNLLNLNAGGNNMFNVAVYHNGIFMFVMNVHPDVATMLNLDLELDHRGAGWKTELYQLSHALQIFQREETMR